MTKRVRTAKSRMKAPKVASGRPGGPTRKRLKHISADVMRQGRRYERALDRQANAQRRRCESPTRSRSQRPGGESLRAKERLELAVHLSTTVGVARVAKQFEMYDKAKECEPDLLRRRAGIWDRQVGGYYAAYQRPGKLGP
jgi:hypothetical protein